MLALDLAAAADSRSLIWKAALIAWILAVPFYFVTKFVSVLAHEGGHALAGIALLSSLDRITIKRGAGGETNFIKNPMWPFVILVGVAGYAGPSLFGLMAAWLLLHGRPPELVIWGSMAFLVLMLLAVRGWIGWVVVPILLVVLYRVVTTAGPGVLTLFAYVWTWFLLMSGVQAMIVYIRAKLYMSEDSDSARLQGFTLLPREVWAFVHLLATGAALVWGGSMLLRLPG
jgi:hypothetical protein